MVEGLTCNEDVAGSSPVTSSIHTHLLYIKSTFTLKEDILKAEFEVDLITVTTLVKLKVTIIWGVGRVVEGAGLENQ